MNYNIVYRMMKPILFLVIILLSNSLFSQSRDPRSKDQANVFWDGTYSLFSLTSDKEIRPNINGLYVYWGTTNESPSPKEYSLRKGEKNYVYKFISYIECIEFCNVVRSNKKMPLLNNSNNSSTSSNSVSDIQKTESVDDFISKMAPSNRTVSNVYIQNGGRYDFNIEYEHILGLLEAKKRHIKLLKELRSELEEYDSRKSGGRHKLEFIKEQYEKACSNQVLICDEKLLKKFWKKELFLSKEFDFSTIDFNSTTPLIYSEKSFQNTVTRYILILKENKKDRNGNIISSFLYKNSSTSDVEKIQKFLKDKKPLEDLERKVMVGKVTGLDDRFFEIERLIMEASQRNEMLLSKFRLTEKGGLYIGEMRNNEYSGFGMMYNSLSDTIFVGEWDKNYPDLKNGKLFQYNCSKNEIYINDNSNTFISYPPTGDVFCGQTVDKNRNGKGAYIWANDNFYYGDWISGERTGTGIFIWQNGDRFEGSFYLGDRTGYGKYTFASGGVWEGNWQGTNFSGIGKQISKNGTIAEGLFENGKLIKTNQQLEDDRIADVKKKEEEKKLKEEQVKKNAELYLSLLRSAFENNTESQPKNSTNNQNNKSSNNSGTSKNAQWVDVKCDNCNKEFKFRYWDKISGWKDEYNSKRGHIKCSNCEYGKKFTNIPSRGEEAPSKSCYISTCNGGWVECSKCYGSGTVRELH